MEALHNGGCDPQTPYSGFPLRQVDEWRGCTADQAMVANEQSAEVFTASFVWRVTADHELLLLGQLHFDPGTTAPADGPSADSKITGKQAA